VFPCPSAGCGGYLLFIYPLAKCRWVEGRAVLREKTLEDTNHLDPLIEPTTAFFVPLWFGLGLAKHPGQLTMLPMMKHSH
jgi:hypothetical protein